MELCRLMSFFSVDTVMSIVSKSLVVILLVFPVSLKWELETLQLKNRTE